MRGRRKTLLLAWLLLLILAIAGSLLWPTSGAMQADGSISYDDYKALITQARGRISVSSQTPEACELLDRIAADLEAVTSVHMPDGSVMPLDRCCGIDEALRAEPCDLERADAFLKGLCLDGCRPTEEWAVGGIGDGTGPGGGAGGEPGGGGVGSEPGGGGDGPGAGSGGEPGSGGDGLSGGAGGEPGSGGDGSSGGGGDGPGGGAGGEPGSGDDGPSGGAGGEPGGGGDGPGAGSGGEPGSGDEGPGGGAGGEPGSGGEGPGGGAGGEPGSGGDGPSGGAGGEPGSGGDGPSAGTGDEPGSGVDVPSDGEPDAGKDQFDEEGEETAGDGTWLKRVPIWLWVLLAVALACLVVGLVVVFKKRKTGLVEEPVPEEDEPGGEIFRIEPIKALDWGRQLALQGRYREAVRYLVLAVLCALDEKGLLRFERTLTNRELLASARANSTLAQSLSPVVATFDRVWYGFEPFTLADYDRLAGQVEMLEQF